ncbi:MAG: four helix bundle protein [Bacteroidetes bacterium]|nr:four helix bundle protein [Bacteroidota bacterium]
MVAENEFVFEDPKAAYNREKDFTSLICWQDAQKVKLFLYKEILPKLPSEEKFNLDNQIRKSTCSSTANIAEGYGRYHFQDATRFYRISRGSTYESKDHLITCMELQYIDEEIFKNGIELIEKAKISINGYIRYIKSKNSNLK